MSCTTFHLFFICCLLFPSEPKAFCRISRRETMSGWRETPNAILQRRCLSAANEQFERISSSLNTLSRLYYTMMQTDILRYTVKTIVYIDKLWNLRWSTACLVGKKYAHVKWKATKETLDKTSRCQIELSRGLPNACAGQVLNYGNAGVEALRITIRTKSFFLLFSHVSPL